MKTAIISLIGLVAYAVADEDHKPPPPISLTWGIPTKPTALPPFTTSYTTSTVFSTSVFTVTSCPPSVPHCPVASTVTTTVIVPISTTVCPVTVTPAPPPPPPSTWGSWIPSPPVVLPPPTSVAVPPPPPAPTTKPVSVGTLVPLPPTSVKPPPAVVTAGAVQNAQMAGGALAAIAVAAALF